MLTPEDPLLLRTMDDRGVLTLIEVLFNSSEIINEQSPDDQTCDNQEV